MQGAEAPPRHPRTLFTFNSKADIQQIAVGCDADIGGTSTVNFDLDESPENNASIDRQATAKFWGHMRLGVRHGLEGKLRGGYAGFRNKVRLGAIRPLVQMLNVHAFGLIAPTHIIWQPYRGCLKPPLPGTPPPTRW